MPLEFRHVQYRQGDFSLDVNLSFMDGMIVGLTGPNGSGKAALLELAGGLRSPDRGEITGFKHRATSSESIRSGDPGEVGSSIDSALRKKPHLLIVGASFSLTDPEYQARTLAAFHELRRRGAIILLASHDLLLLERHCDEVVVLEAGGVADRGDPQLVLKSYRERIQQRVRGESAPAEMAPSSRHGDERAEVVGLQILDSDDKPTSLVQSGERIAIQAKIRYREAVANPVVGILIRSRIGVNVYGTNTELEKVDIGACRPGDQVELHFRFACNLCPQQYTVTVASHDPDGAAHDWLEDAIHFTVDDTRYTAGVANLKAEVEVRRGENS